MMQFIKMHGLGNDFVIIQRSQLENSQLITTLADRHRGIGFDQAIIVDDTKENFQITFLNADGSHAGGCGNGTRAAAGYFHKKTGQTRFDIAINLPNGMQDYISAEIIADNIAKIQMPKPRFEAVQIPMTQDFYTIYPLNADLNSEIHGFCVNIGNPHIVFIVPNCEKIDLEMWGPKIEHDAIFPERINVEFISVIDHQTIRMRVWERGAGITQACGTGACAAVIAAAHQGLVDKNCQVMLDGGNLDISYDTQTHNLMMQGAYQFVYEGVLAA